MPSSNVHLVILIHGLWGSPAHLAAAKHELESTWIASHGGTNGDEGVDQHVREETSHTGPSEDPVIATEISVEDANVGGQDRPLDGGHNPEAVGGDATGDGEELVVVIAGGMTSQLTYDGVDVCASRVMWEVDQQIEKLEKEGKRVTKFSVTGYSLGGLVARFLVGMLHSRTPSFFEKHHSVSFATIATPHLGIPRYNTFLSTAICWLGSHMLARSGQQLYVTDEYSEEDRRPLLEVMADPSLVFMEALEQFDRILIYGNGIKDDTVPYPSALIETSDHFLEWADRGIDVEVDNDEIVQSWGVDGDTSLDLERRKKKKKKSWSATLGVLPPVLRYPFPYNYVIMVLFPILFPLLFLLLSTRLALDSRKSRRRLYDLARASGAHSTNTKTEASSQIPPSPTPSGLSVEHLRLAIRRVERRIEQDLIESADGIGSPFDGDEEGDVSDEGTFKLATESKSTVSQQHMSVRHSKGISSTSSGSEPPSAPASASETTIQLRLTDSQLKMAIWLNHLPLKKVITWYPEVGNSHAVIIVRDPKRFPLHDRGRGLLRRWASDVLKVGATAR